MNKSLNGREERRRGEEQEGGGEGKGKDSVCFLVPEEPTWRTRAGHSLLSGPHLPQLWRGDDNNGKWWEASLENIQLKTLWKLLKVQIQVRFYFLYCFFPEPFWFLACFSDYSNYLILIKKQIWNHPWLEKKRNIPNHSGASYSPCDKGGDTFQERIQERIEKRSACVPGEENQVLYFFPSISSTVIWKVESEGLGSNSSATPDPNLTTLFWVFHGCEREVTPLSPRVAVRSKWNNI